LVDKTLGSNGPCRRKRKQAQRDRKRPGGKKVNHTVYRGTKPEKIVYKHACKENGGVNQSTPTLSRKYSGDKEIILKPIASEKPLRQLIPSPKKKKASCRGGKLFKLGLGIPEMNLATVMMLCRSKKYVSIRTKPFSAKEGDRLERKGGKQSLR